METSPYWVPSAFSVYFTTSARILQLLSYVAYWERIQLLSVTNECDNMRYSVGCCQASEQFCHHLCHSFMSRGRRACSPDVLAYVIFSKQDIKWNLLPAALFCLSHWGAIVHKTSSGWMRFISTESGVGTLFLPTQVNPMQLKVSYCKAPTSSYQVALRFEDFLWKSLQEIGILL